MPQAERNTPLGVQQQRAYLFALQYRECGWTTYDASTKRVILSLVKRGILEVNEYSQFRIVKTHSA